MKSLLWLLLSVQIALGSDYAIVVSEKTAEDKSWAKVVATLRKKHSGKIVHYEKSVREALPDLRTTFPRYACFVATPHETTKDFVRAVHVLARQLDDDPYADFFWGILSGHDAENALAIARTKKPLTIRNSLACTEIALDRCEKGKWFCELRSGHGVAKKHKEEAQAIRLPQDTTALFVKELNEGKPDLFVTSGHATEKDLQLGYRYRNGVFRNKKDGTLYGADLSGKSHTVNSPNPKVYMPIGNCLMGHLRGPDSMAAAFLRSAGVRQMMGYVEVTWYGYMGWGCLDYFVEQPGRYTFAQAFLPITMLSFIGWKLVSLAQMTWNVRPVQSGRPPWLKNLVWVPGTSRGSSLTGTSLPFTEILHGSQNGGRQKELGPDTVQKRG